VVFHFLAEALLIVSRLGSNRWPLGRAIFGDNDIEIVEILIQDGIQQRGQDTCSVVGGDAD
jgi:hypothetical protein